MAVSLPRAIALEDGECTCDAQCRSLTSVILTSIVLAGSPSTAIASLP